MLTYLLPRLIARLSRIAALLWFLPVGPWHAALAQPQPLPSPAELIQKISQKYRDVESFTLEADIEIGRKSGEDKPRDLLSKAHVNLTAAPGGRYVLRVQPAGQPEHVSQSDGKASWVVIPSLNQYSVKEATPLEPSRFSVTTSLEDVAESRMPAECAGLIVRILSSLSQMADLVDLKGSLLTVLSKKDPEGRQVLLYLTVDSTTLTIRRLVWTTARSSPEGDKVLIRSDMNIKSLQLDKPVDDAMFTFHPPAGAKQLNSLSTSTTPR